MANPGDNKRIELTLAADAGLMLVVRLTAAGVIAKAGITVDRMDDLKLAVEEACNCLMGQERRPDRLHIYFELTGEGIEMFAEGLYEDDTLTAGGLKGERQEDEMEIERCILEALADSVDITVKNGWIAMIGMKAAKVQ